MRTMRTDGIYHPDREATEGTVVAIENGEIHGVRGNVPKGAELIHDSEAYALPEPVDAHSHAPIRLGEGDRYGRMRASPIERAVRAATNLEAGEVVA
jgi:imidazolonepropionase-like amidohydrolase